MLNINSYQENVNQNHSRYHFTPIWTAIIFKKPTKQTKKQKITSVREDMEKLEPLCIAGGTVKWYSYYKKWYDNFSKN